MRLRVLPIPSLLVLVSAAACGSSSNDNGAPGATDAGMDASVLHTAPTMVSTMGGTVASADGNVTLVIPAGALASDVAISIEPIAAPGAGAVAQVYDLEPTGTTFAQPVTLGFHGAALGTFALDAETIATYSGTAWVTSPSTIDGASLATSISHFSPWAVVAKSAALPPPPASGDAGTGDDDASMSAADGGMSIGTNDGGTLVLPDGGDAGPSYPTPNETAGSRLHPIYKKSTFGDGAVMLQRIAMFDTMLGVPCDAGYLADGHLYCVPKTETFGNGGYFADASCTQAVVVGTVGAPSSCADTPQFTRNYLDYPSYPMNVPYGELVHTVYSTPASAKLTGSYYYKSGTSCLAETYDPTQYDVYAVGGVGGATVLDGSTLVAITATYSSTTGATAGRVAAANLVETGADGSRWVADGHVVDTKINHFCGPAYTSTTDNTLRCVPNTYGYEYYANEESTSSCNSTAYHYTLPSDPFENGDPRASFAYVGVNAGTANYCELGGSDTTAGQTLLPVNTTVYEGGGGASCTVVTSNENRDVYATGPAPIQVDPSTYVPVTVTTTDATTNGVSGTSIHVSVTNTVGSDGSIAAGISPFAVDHFDPSTQVVCTPTYLADGAMHCVPTTRALRTTIDPTAATLFADSTCTTQPVVLAQSPSQVCARVPQSPWLTNFAGSQNGCGEENVFHINGPALTATTMYVKSATACTAETVANAGASYYLISDVTAVNPTQFPTVTLSTETK